MLWAIQYGFEFCYFKFLNNCGAADALSCDNSKPLFPASASLPAQSTELRSQSRRQGTPFRKHKTQTQSAQNTMHQLLDKTSITTKNVTLLLEEAADMIFKIQRVGRKKLLKYRNLDKRPKSIQIMVKMNKISSQRSLP